MLILPVALSGQSEPVTFTDEEARADMLQRMGITALRPGKSADPASPNATNYDESLANPCPKLPPILKTLSGDRVTNPEQWWQERRPELARMLSEEVYGKVPDRVPAVNWTVKVEDREFVGRTPVVAKQLIGRVNNRDYPAIEVEIEMMLVVPTNVEGPVPVLMMFGRPAFPAPAQPNKEDLEALNTAFKEMMIEAKPSVKEIFDRYPAYQPITRLPPPNWFAPPPNGDSPATEQLLAAGWGYATISPSSIQADNSAGLTRGIIGLVNKGQPRSPDDWGALRAWAWGAARGLDYLETDTLVNAQRVGIEGVSRYGKAALVAMAFEPRFATALIGSSGKGGVTLHRRIFGETVENLTGWGSHWMAGNYLKYGADRSPYGKMTGCDLPVDAHMMLALCAPRPVFVSYGIPEKGDAEWLDQKGSYMATIAAGVAYKLLGAKDLGVSNDYWSEKMPAVNTGLLEGELAWRQHDGGHTDQPNVQYFIPWAERFMQ
ncbi:alpha/beta hydrolase family protein [Lewinella sp. W8]|uniref:alpha/beta hydrolase family protein n=1 Tax=Lewinella sp. W8 TaxID=2528208 RepID=UPI0034CDCBED